MHKKRQLFRFVWILFNIYFPVYPTCDSVCVPAKAHLDMCGYVSLLVGREHGEQSPAPLFPCSLNEEVTAGPFSLGNCLRNHMRFSAAWLLRLWLFGRDWRGSVFPGAYMTSTFHRLVPRLTFFPFIGLLKAKVKVHWGKNDWSSLIWSICFETFFCSLCLLNSNSFHTFRCIPYPKEHPRPTGNH